MLVLARALSNPATHGYGLAPAANGLSRAPKNGIRDKTLSIAFHWAKLALPIGKSA